MHASLVIALTNCNINALWSRFIFRELLCNYFIALIRTLCVCVCVRSFGKLEELLLNDAS